MGSAAITVYQEQVRSDDFVFLALFARMDTSSRPQRELDGKFDRCGLGWCWRYPGPPRNPIQ